MENNKFEYTYSSNHQEEVESIRKKYLPKEESKLDLLKKLDKQPTNIATARSIALGIFGSLVLGTGMSMCMVFENQYFIPGIVIGIIGLLITILTYPYYQKTLKKQQEKVAPQILALSEELLK